MAYIDIDIEEYIDEISTDVLIEEIKERAKEEKTTLKALFNDRMISSTLKEHICDLLGLNHLASNDDIVSELLYKLR